MNKIMPHMGLTRDELPEDAPLKLHWGEILFLFAVVIAIVLGIALS